MPGLKVYTINQGIGVMTAAVSFSGQGKWWSRRLDPVPSFFSITVDYQQITFHIKHYIH